MAPPPVMRSTSASALTAPTAPPTFTDDINADEYALHNLSELSLIAGGLAHLNGGTPTEAPVVPPPPSNNAWLTTLYDALVARGVIQ